MRLPIPFAFPLTRLVGPGLSVVAILAVLFLVITGRLDLSKIAGGIEEITDQAPAAGDNVAPASDKPRDKILIATLNVQRFGQSKSSNDQVMAQLASICQMFDLIAIQEVQSPDANPIGKLVALINSKGYQYDAIVSEQVGRTSYKEQYAFIYDTRHIRPLPNRSYLVDDPLDRMHREPFVSSFSVINSDLSGQAPFSFTLINAHTDPDEVELTSTDNELNVMADVYVSVSNWEKAVNGEDDVIILGDLNSSRTRMFGLGRIPGLYSLAPQGPTNTRGSAELDHIMINTQQTGEWTRNAGVIDYVRDLQLTEEQALAISDHRVVWAEFNSDEVPPGGNSTLAATPVSTARQ